ncbi:hypothetical protein [Streptomyces syringium]|uniref:hypothetical protein n=1 Tax=Streptomyces syringium TaxID=76729 RepID=UPI00343A9096
MRKASRAFWEVGAAILFAAVVVAVALAVMGAFEVDETVKPRPDRDTSSVDLDLDFPDPPRPPEMPHHPEIPRTVR